MTNLLVKRALESYEELQSVIDQLTPAQLEEIMNLESQTRQRKSIIKRCIRQSTKLYRDQLTRRYLYGTPEFQDNEHRR